MSMLTYKPSDTYLTTKNIEFFLSLIPPSPATGPAPITIDLSAVEFFDPYALIILLLVIHKMTPRPAIVFPKNTSTTRYLETIGFPDSLKNCPLEKRSQIFSPLIKGGKGLFSSPVLLKITEIKNTDDIRTTISRIVDTIGAVLKTHLNYKDEDAANLLTALAELCQNIVDHSESSGFAAMQVYTSQRGAKFAVIGVGDSGIGIKQSLSKRYDTKRWTDAMAIRNALKPHFSRLEGRGLGLTRVKEIAEKYNGTLLLRSNKGLVTFQRRIASRTTTAFPGTQVSIYLRDNKRLL